MRWAGIAPIVRIMQIDADCPNDASSGSAPRPLIHGRLTGEVIGAFYEIYNELGFGFLESVYSSALEIEFRDRRIPYVRGCSRVAAGSHLQGQGGEYESRRFPR